MSKSWYTIKAAAEGSEVAEVSILDYIGMWGVNAQDFLREFRALKASTVKVFINSPGGSVFEALAIFNGMRASGKTVEVHVLGVAASAASYIAMSGDKIVMPANTMMFVHNPINAVYGNAEELRAAADVLDKIGESLLATYRKRFKGEEEALQKLFADESYLTAAECLEYGFCDEVSPEITAEAKFDVDSLPEAVRKVFEGARAQPKAPVLPETPLAAQVKDAAEAAGLGEFAAYFAVRSDTIEAAQAAIREASGIVSLCKVAGVEMAASLIRAGKTLAEARVEVAEARAADDEETFVDSKPRQPKGSRADQTDFNASTIWAEIKAAKQPQRSA